ncbi:16670_t:CDS:2, partial [Dentiscutata heterogama]
PEFTELEKYLKSKQIESFVYSQFSELTHIGAGGFASVYSATFNGQTYALKSLNNNLRFEKKEFKQFKREYANGGNLRDHLQKKQQNGVYKISWADLIRIAKEITLGLDHLHKKKIVHRDLHSMNVLIDNDNNDRALIADFGLSKQLDSATTGAASSTSVKGLPAYIEPQYYIRYEDKVEINKQSDIYSLGVLFWELTSGIPPFKNLGRDQIPFKIAKRIREKIIDNTPLDYANLFKKCWDDEPDQRPSLDQVLDKLDKLSTEITVEFIINHINSNNTSAALNPSNSYTNTSNSNDVGVVSKNISITIKTAEEENIKIFDYKEFSEQRKIGEGGSGIVCEAKSLIRLITSLLFSNSSSHL